MSLQVKVDSLESVDENLRSHYEKKTDDSGKEFYSLNVDLSEQKNKVNEFRNNNNLLKGENERLTKETSELKQQVSELNSQYAKFKDVDIDKLNQFQKSLTEKKEAELLAKGDVDGIIANRVAGMKKGFEDELVVKNETIKRLTGELDNVRASISDMTIDTNLISAINQTGVKVREGAMPDLTNRAKGIWKLEESGQLRAYDGEKPVFSAKDGVTPISMNEWLMGYTNQASHLFEASQGAGSTGAKKMVNGKPTITREEWQAGKNLEEVASGKVVVEG